MSMNYYPSVTVGLMITKHMANNECRKLVDVYFDINQDFPNNENFEIFDFDATDADFEQYVLSNYEGLGIQKLSSSEWMEPKEDFFVIPCSGNIYFWNTEYKSLDDVVIEMKQELQHLLPENFDYLSNLIMASGCYYG